MSWSGASCAVSATAPFEVHCAGPAEVAVARYNARPRHEVHWLKTATLAAMGKYDRPVGSAR